MSTPVLPFPSRPQLVRPVVVQTSVVPLATMERPLADFLNEPRDGPPRMTNGIVRTSAGIVWCTVHYGLSITPVTWVEFVWRGASYFRTETRSYTQEELEPLAHAFARECVAGQITNSPPSEAGR